MAAFSDINQFATEFAIRTQLNYYNLLRQETIDPRNIARIDDRITSLHNIMIQKGYDNVEFCCGTQLINSVLGLLVFPEQQLYQKISKYSNENKWREDFPTLSKYVFNEVPNCFTLTYTFFDKKYRCERPESITPLNILKHMRNAVSHKKIELFPIQSEGNGELNQVTHIVFRDFDDDNLDQVFSLKIKKEDIEDVMLEISTYFINIDLIRERDAR